MSERCPSELKLESHLRKPSEALERHAQSCARCGARLAEMREQGEEFFRRVWPSTVERLEARAPRRWGWLAFGALAAASSVAVGAVLFRAQAPAPDYVGIKGQPLQLSVYRAEAGTGALVHNGEAIPAASELRFKVRALSPCRVWILSVDSVGQVSQLFPAEGEAAPWVSNEATLPGGAILDGRPGPERLFAICSQQPLSFKDLERSAKGTVAQGEQPVRATHELPGLNDALQTSLLVEKTP